MGAKRPTDRLIQGWFDSTKPPDADVVAIFDKLRADYPETATMKQIIAAGILALGQIDYPEFVAGLPRSESDIQKQIRADVRELHAAAEAAKRVLKSVEGLRLTGVSSSAAFSDDAGEVFEELSQLQEGIASRYVEFVMEDEDEDED